MSCGRRARRGERLYDWALADAGWPWNAGRRSLSSGDLAYYLCWSRGAAKLAELVRVVGPRWAVEERKPCRQGRERARPLLGPQADRVMPPCPPGNVCAGRAAVRRGSSDGGPGEDDRAREGELLEGSAPAHCRKIVTVWSPVATALP